MHRPQTWVVYMQSPVANVLEQVTVSALPLLWWRCLLLRAESQKLPRHTSIAQPNTRGAGSQACQGVLRFTSRALLSTEGVFLHVANELLGAPWGPRRLGAASPPSTAVLGTRLLPCLLRSCLRLNSELGLDWGVFPKLGFPLLKLLSWFSGSYQSFRLLPQTGSARAF